MNKVLTIAVMAAALAGQASAGGAALEALGELAGPEAAVQAPAPDACREPGPGATIEEIIAWIRCVELPPPPGAADAAEKRTLVHPKIRVSPVTAAWRDTMLVKFRKVSFDTVRAAMSAAGARTWTFGENDGLYIVRLDVADAKAPAMARALAAQPAVDAVEVNRAVYDALREAPQKASRSARGAGLFDELNLEACPGWQEAGPGAAVCRVDGAWQVFRLPVRREHQVARLPFNDLWDAVSLNIWPDDCTEMIYDYAYELFDAAGRKAGYAERHGYANSELEARLDLLLKYDLRGELVSVEAY